MGDRMDIRAKPGTKVKVVQEGFDGHFPNMEKLEMGAVYTVSHTRVHDWHTDVYLEEFPGLHFNSVQFVEVE